MTHTKTERLRSLARGRDEGGQQVSIDPNGIPRYAPPTPAELADMFAEPTPAECMEDCPHRWACRMQWERLGGIVDEDVFGWTDDLARLLGCGEDCECAE